MKMTAQDGHLFAEVTLRDVLERTDVSDLPFLTEIKRLYDENAKLRELAENLLMGFVYLETMQEQQECIDRALDLRRELDVLPMERFDARDLGIEEVE